MKNYEVRLEYGYCVVVTVEAEDPETARKLAKERAVLGLEMSYDDKLVDDVSGPSVVDSFVYQLEQDEDIPFS